MSSPQDCGYIAYIYIALRNHFHLNLLLLKLFLAITLLGLRNINAGMLAFNPAHIRKSVWGQERWFLIVLLSAPECDMLNTQCPLQLRITLQELAVVATIFIVQYLHRNFAFVLFVLVSCVCVCVCACVCVCVCVCVYPIFLFLISLEHVVPCRTVFNTSWASKELWLSPG